MLQVLLFLAIVIIGVQAIAIALLVNVLKDIKGKVKKERLASKNFTRELINVATDYKREAEDYKEAYHACYSEYKELFGEIRAMKKHLDYVEKLHSHMVNNMHTLLKQKRVIKTEYMGNLIPYESFSSLPDSDRIELFGA